MRAVPQGELTWWVDPWRPDAPARQQAVTCQALWRRRDRQAH
ncbi:MAG: hypothetical protein ACR2HZ_01945 [Gemmatimonadaceae bacterium]